MLKKILFLMGLLFIVPTLAKAASISSISPEYVIPGETIVTITGSGFGNSTSGKFISFGSAYAYSTNWNDSQIQVKVPSSVTTSGEIEISGSFVVGQSCYGTYCYDETAWQDLTKNFYLLPQITEKTEQIFEKGIFMVFGKYFGTTAGTIILKGERCNILEWEDFGFRCEVPKLDIHSGDAFYTITIPSQNNYKLTGLVKYSESISQDTYSNRQSYLTQSKITDIWSKYSGNGVTVAVIDSGVDLNNPDLKYSMWSNSKEILNNQVDDDKNGYIDDYYGYNFIDDNADMSPKNNHGTMVSGIIAAKRDNNIGIAGIAPNAKIMPLTVCSDNGCPKEAIKKAIKYAVDNGANIINLSLGGDGSLGYDPSYDESIKYAFDRGVLIVAAAGNGDTEGAGTRGQDMGAIKASPVCNDGTENMILGVGALKSDNNPTQWTNYSVQYVDVSAPGENMFSTVVPMYTDGYWYDEADGTSFSAPMVAGVAALLKEKNPTWKNYEIMNQIISRSDVFPKGWNVYGTILNAKSIFDNDSPKIELENVSPSVIDGSSSKVVITGKYFYKGMHLKFSNNSFIGDVPSNLMTIHGTYVEIDLARWDGFPTSSSKKYSITTNSVGSIKNSLPNSLEIKNLVKVSGQQNQDTPDNNQNTSAPENNLPINTSYIEKEKSLVKNISNNLTNSLKGKILLQVESLGEAWYVNPSDGMKYYLQNGAIAYEALKKFGDGISNIDIAKIPVGVEKRFSDIDTDGDGLANQLEEGLKTDQNIADTDGDGVSDGKEILENNTNPLGTGSLKYNSALVNRFRGRILLQVESLGEAWYINPDDGKRYYMKNGEAAYQIMRFLSLGITNDNLRKIDVGNL